ncbi:MAG TPA: hypothetical protein VLH19_04470 [Patescibacteria group bacterium]|nr:hypothetical protein [Patescibacteria group bacterium]
MLIAQGTQVIDIAGSATTISPVQTVGKLIQMGAGAILVVGAIAVLMYLLLGALNWLTAGGDKSKVETAKSEITQAIIGLAILASVFAVFGVLLDFFGLRDRIGLTQGIPSSALGPSFSNPNSNLLGPAASGNKSP